MATIDTGATRSFISEAVARELGTARNQRTILTRISLADGTQRDVTQALVVRIHLGQRYATMPMLVLPTILDDIILGMDFLCEVEGRLECGQAQLQLGPDSSEKTPISITTMRPSLPTTHGRPAEEPTSNRNRTWLPQTCASAIRNNPFRRPRDTGSATEEPTSSMMAKRRNSHSSPKLRADDITPGKGCLGMITEPGVSAPVATESLGIPEEIWVKQFLQEELGKFEGLTGVSSIAEHTITLRDNRPIKQRYYPKNPAMQKIINDQVDELLRDDRIEPSRSPHSAPIVLVGKKTGDVRMCVDYRQLNARSVPDAYPLPRTNHILEKLRNAKYISTLDLKSGYWQIPMAKGSREYTAFTVPGRGLYHWKVMPFGLHSAPATFQRALDSVIGPDMEPHAFAYLDDIIIIGSSLKEHATNLREVLRRLREANLKLNKDKCSFFQKSLVYLGHVVSEAGIHTDPEKINAIKELAPPTSVKELRRCLGIASWYRRFVPNFTSIVQPISKLLRKGQKWTWDASQERAFQELKTRLTEAPVLACPNFNERFSLQTDASDYGLGAVLTQRIEGIERVIAYASRRLSPAEENYSTTEKECLAIQVGRAGTITQGNHGTAGTLLPGTNPGAIRRTQDICL
ncbi:hypothetical protein ACLKA7_007742 [Drosophila subpalustris]